MSSTEQLQGKAQPDAGKLEAAVGSGISIAGGLTMNGTTNGSMQDMPIGSGTTVAAQMSSTTIPEPSSFNFGTGDPLTYNNPSTHQTLGGIGVAGYSAFPSAATPSDGSWTATAFDPSIMGGFGFTGASMLTPNQGFFFPSTDVWSQTDPLMMNNNWLMSSVPMDQPQIPGTINLGVSNDGTVPNTLETVASIDQTFNGLTLNGSGGNGSSILPPIGGGSSDSTGGSNNNGGGGGGGSTTVGSTAQQLVGGSTGTTPQVMQPQSTVDSSSVTAPTPPQETKPKSWAAIASQPAKPKPPLSKPVPQPKEDPPKRQTSVGSSRNNIQGVARGPPGGHQSVGQLHQTSTTLSSSSNYSNVNGNGLKRNTSKGDGSSSPKKMIDVVSKLKSENTYNPSELTLSLNNARYFVIKSYAEDDVHRSIKYNVWCSTEHGNRRLDMAFKEQKAKGGSVYLFFSVNGSGHFCGVAKMVSEVDLCDETGIWTQDKWKGKFDLKWIYIKDVPNGQLRHIRLENNENKPVTNSRDTQEVPLDKGKMVMKVIHSYNHTTSIFDDFEHYEKRQEEETIVDNEHPTMTTNTNRKDRK